MSLQNKGETSCEVKILPKHLTDKATAFQLPGKLPGGIDGEEETGSRRGQIDG